VRASVRICKGFYDFLSGGVPEVRGTIVVADSDGSTIRRERDRVDTSTARIRIRKGVGDLPGADVPQVSPAVEVGGGDCFAIRRECKRVEVNPVRPARVLATFPVLMFQR
jgi:hypothetical protein